jgi:hypothetical protein
MRSLARLAQAFRLHDLGVDCRTGGHGRNAACKPLLVDVNEQVHAEARRRFVAEGDHLAEFPGCIDVQQWERRFARMEGLLRHVQKYARILAHRVEHHGIAKLAHDLAHNKDCLGLKSAQANVLMTPIHPMNPLLGVHAFRIITDNHGRGGLAAD